MIYISSAQAAEKWGISERSVRNYCAGGRVEGAFLKGKTWNIPENAEKPARGNNRVRSLPLKDILKREKESKLSGGIYHRVQIELTYNSNHIEGSRLTHDQTRYIYETNTIGISEQPARVDDIIETANHFLCVDMIISNADKKLSQSFIKELHRTLKSGTSNSRRSWFAVGEYKRFPNEVGGEDTTSPEDTGKELRKLILWYEGLEVVSLEDILDFHVRFEKIHPFQDGNGRVGRLVMFKECLRNNIVPFIIDEGIKIPYYNGLKNWGSERGYLIGTCGLAQDAFKSLLDYFNIKY
ncbi:MAG: Fic family protein [Oscillospiraceae bacterium]|nr:Fic family protein [Oscillospiraceae bacterium]